MGLNDMLYFDGPAYKTKLESLVASNKIHEIQLREVKKIRQIWGSSTKIGVGVILALPTMGMSYVSSVVGLRQLWIACAKLAAIKATLKKYGITPYKCELRDAVIPIVVTVLTTGIGFGIAVGISDLAAMGLQEAAMHGITPAVNHGIGAALESGIHNPDVFAHGMMHGVHAQAQVHEAIFQSGGVASNVAHAEIQNAIPTGFVGGDAFVDGAIIGAKIQPAAEQWAAQQAVTSSLGAVADKETRQRLDRKKKSA